MNSLNFWIKYKEHSTIKDLSNDFKCSKCQKPLVEPYLLSCSDQYCLQCKDELFSKEIRICEICNEVVDGLIFDRKIIKKLKEIEISCLNSYECIWKGDLTIFENHCNDCLFQKVECDFYCGEFITRNELLNHKSYYCQEREINCEYCNILKKSKNYMNHLDDECNDFPINCPNECKTNQIVTKLKRKELETHFEICHQQNISCLICKEIQKRNQMENHLKEDMYSHFLVLYNEITLLKKDKELQEDKISQNKQQIIENQQEISILKEVVQNLAFQNDFKDEEIQKLKQEQNEYILQFNKLDLKINSLPENIILSHGSEVNGLLKFSEDLLISGGFKDIKYWNPYEYNLIHTIHDAHRSKIYSLKNLNRNLFISAGEDLSIKIWNVETRESIKTFTVEHTNFIWDLLILSNNRIASASFDSMIKIWDMNSFNSIKTLNGHSNKVRSLIEMRDDEIISCSSDKTIKFWDLNINKTIMTIIQSYPIDSSVKISDCQFASGSYKEIKIYNYPDGNCLRTLRGHKDYIYDLILLDSNIIASGSGPDDKSIKVWNACTGEILNSLNGHTDCVFKLVKLNDSQISSGSSDGNLIIWRNFLKKNKN